MTLGPRRFAFDVAGERATARLRLAGAAIVFPASIALAVTLPTILGALFALAGAGVSLGWVFAYRGAKKRIARADQFSLLVDQSGISLALGGEPVALSWRDVRSVDLDDERLEVALRREGGSSLRIPPIFAGVALPDLADLLERHRDGASSPARD
jgi:hypothetical protein